MRLWFQDYRFYSYSIGLGRPKDPDHTFVCNTSEHPLEMYFGHVSMLAPVKPEPDAVIEPFEKYPLPNYQGEITLIWRP